MKRVMFFVVWAVGSLGGSIDAAVVTSRDGFVSGGVAVRVDRFLPAGPGKHPALLLVHGLHSVQEAAPLLESSAGRYAEKGYAVFLVHYFERTGTRDGDIAALIPRFQRFLGGSDGDAATRELFGQWLDTLRDALAYVRRQTDVDETRLGLAGISLGAFLSVTLASEEGSGIVAVVDLFGGMPLECRDRARRLPPVLIVHGDRDTVVPVAEAEALRRLLSTHGIRHEVLILKGVGHVFQAESGRFRWDAALRAEWAIHAFLNEHLAVKQTTR